MVIELVTVYVYGGLGGAFGGSEGGGGGDGGGFKGGDGGGGRGGGGDGFGGVGGGTIGGGLGGLTGLAALAEPEGSVAAPAASAAARVAAWRVALPSQVEILNLGPSPQEVVVRRYAVVRDAEWEEISVGRSGTSKST